MDIINKWISENGYQACAYGSSPRVIIIGESHHDTQGAKKQIQLVSQLNVNTLLHEFARNYVYDFVQKRIYENPQHSTPRAAIKFGIRTINDAQIDFMDEEFVEWLELRRMKCELRAYEFAYHALDFSGNFGRFLSELPVSISTIIGCDVSHAETYLYQKENKVELCTKGCPDFHHRFREERFGEVIGDYALQASSPVIAVMGSTHIRPISHIHKQLQERRLEYLCVGQMK